MQFSRSFSGGSGVPPPGRGGARELPVQTSGAAEEQEVFGQDLSVPVTVPSNA